MNHVYFYYTSRKAAYHTTSVFITQTLPLILIQINRSRCGKIVATGGTAGVMRVWDYSSGRLINSSGGHSGPILAISFSPDDRQIVSVAEDGSIILWCVYRDDRSALLDK